MKSRRAFSRWLFSSVLAFGSLLSPVHLVAQSMSTEMALSSILTSPDHPELAAQRVDDLTQFISNQMSMFPVASSTGSFSWVFDPVLGLHVRRSNRLGPVFGERASTTGRNKLSAALQLQQTQWLSIGGQKLSEGLLDSQIEVSPVNSLVTAQRWDHRSVFELTTQRAAFLASYGLTDDLDVGFVVPLMKTTVTGWSETRYTGPGGASSASRSPTVSGETQGLGDVTARLKYNFLSRTNSDLSIVAQVSTSGKDTSPVIGSGATSKNIMLIAEIWRGSVSSHLNVGATFSNPTGDISCVAGVDVAAHSSVTLTGQIIGRWFTDPVKVGIGYTTYYGSPLVPSIVTSTASNVILAAASAKVRLPRGFGKLPLNLSSWVISASVLFPLSAPGLTPSVTPVIGLERAF